jgi:hypothetical protein
MMSKSGREKIVAVCAAAIAGVVVEAGGLAVPPDGVVVQEVTNALAVTRPAIEGLLRKEGGELLELNDPDIPNSVVEVRGGSLRLTADHALPAAVMPPAWLAGSAALWFDATTNAVTGEGTNGVVQWLDARETTTQGPYVYPRAVQHDDDPVPLLAADGLESGGRGYLDFGGFGSGRWLKWVRPDGARLEVANILYAAIVFGRQPGFGFLLGDWDWTQAGNVGRKDYHIGGLGEDVNSADSCWLWFAANTAVNVQYGNTWLDGMLVDGLRTRPKPDYQLIEVAAAGDTGASNFCNDHNFKAGMPGTTIDRQGGPRFCEAILFTNALSAAGRAEVAAYLTEKWLTRAPRAGRIDTAAETRVEADAGAGTTLALGGVEGDGLFVKNGAGSVRLVQDNALFRGAAVLAQGSIDAPLQRTDRAFEVFAGGTELTASQGGIVSRDTLADGGLFRKSGNGALALARLTGTVERVEVAAGTLRLSAPLERTGVAARAVIPNAGFEAHAAVTANSGTYQTGLSPTGWTLITSGNNGKAGITLDNVTTPWVTQGAIPEGGSAVFFQYAGGVKTGLQVPQAGRYRLSFQAAARADLTGYSRHVFGVWLGEQQVAVAKTYWATFERYEYMTPWLTNGTYELRFQGLSNDAQNRSSVIDDVRLELLDSRASAEVANGGFEWSEHFGTFADPLTYMLMPTAAAWTFEGAASSGVSEATPWAVPGQLYARVVPEGRRCAIIRRDGVIRQTVAFPDTGTVYRLSFRAAGRENREGHTFQVTVDGAPVLPYARTADSVFRLYEVTLPPVTNWSAEIAFRGLVASTTSDLWTLLDDVRLTRVDEAPVANGSFETTTSLADGVYTTYATFCEGASWVFGKGTGINGSGISGTHSLFGRPVSGGRMAFLQSHATISQTLALPGEGVWTLSFLAAGSPGGDRNRLGHTFEVCWGGQRLGVLTVTDPVFRRYAFRLPYTPTATSAELLFRGLIVQTQFSLLDDVRIERETVETSAGLLPESVHVSVVQGAKLDLDFGGTLKVNGVALDGREKSGVISAATYPEFVTGAGALYTPARGTIISVR